MSKKHRSKNLWANIVWGVMFGIIAACIFAGVFRSNITIGIVFIMWTYNGFLLGRSYEIHKQIDEMEEFMAKLDMIIKEMHGDNQ